MPMKDIEVKLHFGADVTEAKRQIQSLQESLQKVAALPASKSALFDDSKIKAASQAALELQQHLTKAVNVDTGRLDLSRFSASLKASNKDLQTYSNQLLNVGATGQQAFLKMAQSISNAEIPTVRLGKKLTEMGTALMNAARWQISSSILHGFMGTVSSAYNYAKDLNESLNNIRIVTGQNTEQMAKFAEQANKAAKILGTTTTNYTDASLIYYQQGLKGDDVTDRTDVTIKMANVAGTSAQQASQQLTSIWNNFYDGSKSLEYYADVMTALGASTASSSEEIAEGIQKFAAIGNTVGLSYEYAASALATITATTRESADTVGNALKTLFSRIQGLKLGETLDDGTDLNKYSAALASVGVNIKDTNGDLKDMDAILDELGAKWSTLGKDQQMALAQTVAGVRQYAQLIALMDNWDFMKTNLDTANSAEGTLSKQAEIYEESWEASSKRVKASLEGIYDNLIDDKFFIGLNNAFATMLDSVKGLSEGFGGLGGILSMIVSIFLTNFARKMPDALAALAANFRSLGKSGMQSMNEIQTGLQARLKEIQLDTTLSDQFKQQAAGIARVTAMRQKLLSVQHLMTNSQKQEYENRIANIESLNQELQTLQQNLKSKDTAARYTTNLMGTEAHTTVRDREETFRTMSASDAGFESTRAEMTALQTAMKECSGQFTELKNKSDTFFKEQGPGLKMTAEGHKALTTMVSDYSSKLLAAQKVAQTFKSAQEKISSQGELWKKESMSIEEARKKAQGFVDQMKQVALQQVQATVSAEKLEGATTDVNKAFQGLSDGIAKAETSEAVFDVLENASDAFKNNIKLAQDQVDDFEGKLLSLGVKREALDNLSQGAKDIIEAFMALGFIGDKLKGLEDQGPQIAIGLTQAFTSVASGALQTYNAINSITNAIDRIKEGDLSGWEAFGLILSGLTSSLFALKSMTQAAEVIYTKYTVSLNKNTVAKKANASGSNALKTAEGQQAVNTNLADGAQKKLNASMWASPITWITMAIIAATAVIALFVVSIIDSANALSEEEKAAQKASEAISELKDAAEDAKTTLNDLQTSFNKYDEAVKAFQLCTKGTKEWHEALKNVNQIVLDLLEKYPNLISEMNITRDSNGMFVLDGTEDILQKAEDLATASQQAAIMGSVIASVKRNQADQANFYENVIGAEDADRLVKANGTSLTDSGAAAIVKENLSVFGSLDESTYNDTVDKLFKSYTYNVKEVTDTLKENQQELQKLSLATQKVTEQFDIAADTIAADYFADTDYANNEVAIQLGSAAYQSAYDSAYNKIINEANRDDGWWIFGQKGLDKEDSDDYWEQYLGIIGQDYQLTKKGYEDGIYHYRGTDGEKEVSIEAVAATIAANEAMTAMGEKANEAMELWNRLQGQAQETMTDFVTGMKDDQIDYVHFLGEYTQKGQEKIAEAANMVFTSPEWESLIDTKTGEIDKGAVLNNVANETEVGKAFEELAGSFGMNASDFVDMLNTTETSFADFITHIQEILGDGTPDNTGNGSAGLTEYQQDEYKGDYAVGFDTSEMSENEKANFANARMIAREDTGLSLYNQSDIEKDNASNIKGLENFYKGLASIDTKAAGASQEIAKLAEQYGITGDSLNAYIEKVSKNERISVGLSGNLAETIKETDKVVSKLKDGAIVEEADILNFKELGINTDKYFTKMADGTYKLIAAADDFNKVVSDTKVDAYGDKLTGITEVLQTVSRGSPVAYAGNIYNGTVVDNKGTTVGQQTQAHLDSMRENYAGYQSTGYDYDTVYNLLHTAQNMEGLDLSEEANLTISKFVISDQSVDPAEAVAAAQEVYSALYQARQETEALMFNEATSLEDIDRISEKILATGTKIDTEALAVGLTNLASNYSNCKEELSDFYSALASGNEELQAKAIDTLESSILAGEAAKNFGLDAEELEAQAEQLSNTYNQYNLTAKGAMQLAIQNQRMNKGVTDLKSNWSDWKKVLDATDKTSADYAKTVKEVTNVVKDLVGAVGDFKLPKGFLDDEKNIELLGKAAQGDIKAINNLGFAVAKSQANVLQENKTLQDSFDSLTDEQLKNVDERVKNVFDSSSEWNFNDIKNKVVAGMESLQAAVEDGTVNISSYWTTLSDTLGNNWVESLNQLAIATGMTVDEMNSMLNEMGVEAEVQTVQVPTTVSTPIIRTETVKVNDDPLTTETKSWTVRHENAPGFIEAAQINMGDANSGKKPKYVGNGSVAPSSTKSSGGGGGGSSSKPSKTKKTKKSDVVDRYKEVDDSIDNLTKTLDKANKQQDRLYGANRIANMKRQNELTKESVQLLEQKTAEAKKYLEEDRKALDQAAANAGVQFQYNEYGDIVNYTEEMTKLYEQLAAAEDKMNAMSTKDAQDKYKEEYYDPLKEKFDELKEAISQYDETNGLLEDLESEIQDKLNEIQDRNFEAITYELEVKLEIDAADLKIIDFYLSQLEDDVYSAAEAFEILGQKLGPVNKDLEAYKNEMEQIEEAYQNGEISEEQYVEGLQQARDGMLDTLSTLTDLDKEMTEYYANTLDKVQEEMDKWMNRLEHGTKVLDHYKNILDATGQSKDFGKMGIVLEARAENLAKTMEFSKQQFEMYSAQAEDWATKMANSVEGSEEWKQYYTNWEAAEEKARDAQDRMLSDTEAWVQATRDVVNNQLAGFGQDLENALTGGTSFEQLNTQMEHAKSLQEEYLTTTNKIYETTKLMRTAQKEIDKSSNTVAKQRLKQFVDETQALQDQNKVSNYELEIQQAKYNLLLAEIALQDAQDAKSQVRLQRDSEGNFGYVYTADQDKVADAQQKFEDAENNLYNIALRGANDYTEKYHQTMQEMYDTLQDLHQRYLDGEFESEAEYQAAVEEAKGYYFEKLENYSNLYHIAVGTHLNAESEAWANAFGGMDLASETWKNNVNTYLSNVDTALTTYKSKLEEAKVTAPVEELKNAVDAVTTASNDLIQKIGNANDENSVIGRLAKEIAQVNASSTAWGQQKQAIKETVDQYTALIAEINATVRAMAGLDTTPPEAPTSETPSSSNTTSQNNNTTSSSANEGSSQTTNSPSPPYTPSFHKEGYSADSVTVSSYSPDSGYIKLKNNKYVKLTDLNYKTLRVEGDKHILSGPIQEYSKYDTGGYTGAWGPDGKFAMLHEKELVLNKADTANILDSVSIVRDMIKTLDMHSLSAQIGGILSSPGFFGQNRQGLEQNIHIEANFPNATDRYEIEEAFASLSNQASQLIAKYY